MVITLVGERIRVLTRFGDGNLARFGYPHARRLIDLGRERLRTTDGWRQA